MTMFQPSPFHKGHFLWFNLAIKILFWCNPCERCDSDVCVCVHVCVYVCVCMCGVYMCVCVWCVHVCGEELQ